MNQTLQEEHDEQLGQDVDTHTQQINELSEDLRGTERDVTELRNRLEALEYKCGDGECEEKWTLLFENGNLDIDDDNQLHMYDSIEAAELAAGDFDSNPKPVKIQIIVVDDN